MCNTLKKCNTWLIDGTFHITPRTFKQVLIIQGDFIDKTYPLAYILLTSKDTKLYIRALAALKNIFPFMPKNIIVDFEKALINACTYCFPTAMLNGCLFHFSQSIWRNIKRMKELYQEYRNNNPIIKELIRKIINLAFVPEDSVLNEYNLVIFEINTRKLDDIFSDFREYFESMYIGRIRNGRFFHPEYSITFFFVHERIKQYLPRTTNVWESFHSVLNKHDGKISALEFFIFRKCSTQLIIQHKFNYSIKNSKKIQKFETMKSDFNQFF